MVGKYFLISVVVLSCAGCASATPLDWVWPAPVPLGVTNYVEHPVLSFKGITTLSILKATQREIEFKHQLNEFEYQIASNATSVTIKASERARDGFVGLLATIGLGGTAALPLALKRVPKGAVKQEDHDRAVKEALETPV